MADPNIVLAMGFFKSNFENGQISLNWNYAFALNFTLTKSMKSFDSLKINFLIKLCICFYSFHMISCSKECQNNFNNCCIDFSQIPSKNVANSPDLIHYPIRPDSTIGTSIKLVPNQGYINWRSNVEVTTNSKGRYGLVMRNYKDTFEWSQLDSWINKRELISIEFNINVNGKQKIVNDELYSKD